jgi:hypothetical protein
MQPSVSVPHLNIEANETFGPGNPGRGPFIRLPARKRPGMSRSPLAKGRRSAIYGILFVTTLIAGASAAYAADGCPSSASEISTDRPDVTNSSRVVPYGACRRRTASTGASVRDPMLSADPRRGCVSASRNAPKYWPTCLRTFTPSTAGRRPDFPTSLSPSRGNCPFPSAFAYLQPAVWDFRPAPAKSQATATILTSSSLGRDESATSGRS